jgi:F-type H+-transporting ATPase subunit delta
MEDNSLYNRYALAFLEVAKKEKKIEEYRKEIMDLKDFFKSEPNFVRVLKLTDIPKEKRYDIIDKVFKDFSADSRNYLKIIVKNNRAYFTYKILKETLFRFDDYLEIEEGTLFSSFEMNSQQIEVIKKAVEKNVKRRVELKLVVDPNLIGGFVVSLKNDIFDASMITKINGLKSSLIKD